MFNQSKQQQRPQKEGQLENNTYWTDKISKNSCKNNNNFYQKLLYNICHNTISFS